jgi:uncharacterized caspase-like protein
MLLTPLSSLANFAVFYKSFSTLTMTNRAIGKIHKSEDDVPKGKMHFFGIGIDAYQNWQNLKNAVNDLEALEEILLKYYDFEETNMVILKNEQATRKAIVNYLHAYTQAGKLGEHDSLLIYFSGHGDLDDNDDGYWVPVDSQRGEIDTFVANENILKSIKNMKCLHVLLISDSCYSGSLTMRGAPPSLDNLVATTLAKKKSRWLLTSGDKKEAVADGSGKHSPFADAILSELKQNDKSLLIADELAINVRKIAHNNANQMAQYESFPQSGDLGGRFVFRKKQSEETEWQRALSLNTEGGYLEQNTDEKFADEATDKLDIVPQKASATKRKVEKKVPKPITKQIIVGKVEQNKNIFSPSPYEPPTQPSRRWVVWILGVLSLPLGYMGFRYYNAPSAIPLQVVQKENIDKSKCWLKTGMMPDVRIKPELTAQPFATLKVGKEYQVLDVSTSNQATFFKIKDEELDIEGWVIHFMNTVDFVSPICIKAKETTAPNEKPNSSGIPLSGAKKSGSTKDKSKTTSEPTVQPTVQPKNEEIGCFLTAGWHTMLHKEATPFSEQLIQLKEGKKYKILDRQTYNHGPNTFTCYYVNGGNGYSGWVEHDANMNVPAKCR